MKQKKYKKYFANSLRGPTKISQVCTGNYQKAHVSLTICDNRNGIKRYSLKKVLAFYIADGM